MNYPTHLVDKKQKREPSPREETFDLSFIHQQRTNISLTQLYKPFTSFSKDKPITRKEGVGSPPKGFKASVYTLTTTPFENRKFLV